jgi:hypothetical protein
MAATRHENDGPAHGQSPAIASHLFLPFYVKYNHRVNDDRPLPSVCPFDKKRKRIALLPFSMQIDYISAHAVIGGITENTIS